MRQVFAHIKAIPKHELIALRYKEQRDDQAARLRTIRTEYQKATSNLDSLKGEVVMAIQGQSSFSKELLATLIAQGEENCRDLATRLEEVQRVYDSTEALKERLMANYEELVSWAELYNTASLEAKKMIVSTLIRRIEVSRDYRINLEFNISLEQFGISMPLEATSA